MKSKTMHHWNKAKSIGAQLSVNVVAAAVIDTDADVDTDDATDSTVADFAFAATFATFTNFAKFPSFATLVTFDTFATFVSFADGDHDVLSHLHWTWFCMRFPKIYNTYGV